MVNRSKAKGTAAETAVVRWARLHGFPGAERLPLAGANDMGDVRLDAGAIVEVKAGRAAESASRRQIETWLAETERERSNAGAGYALLVVKRRGVSGARAGDWDCYQRLDQVRNLMGGSLPGGRTAVPVCMTFTNAAELLIEGTWPRGDAA